MIPEQTVIYFPVILKKRWLDCPDPKILKNRSQCRHLSWILVLGWLKINLDRYLTYPSIVLEHEVENEVKLIIVLIFSWMFLNDSRLSSREFGSVLSRCIPRANWGSIFRMLIKKLYRRFMVTFVNVLAKEKMSGWLGMKISILIIKIIILVTNEFFKVRNFPKKFYKKYFFFFLIFYEAIIDKGQLTSELDRLKEQLNNLE